MALLSNQVLAYHSYRVSDEKMAQPSSDADDQLLSKCLEEALKQWHHEEAQISLADLLPHLLRQIEEARGGDRVLSLRQVNNQLLLNLLETLADLDADAATLLRRRYIDDETGFAVANSLGISESVFYRRRREALRLLTEVAISQEREARVAHAAKLENRLEAPSYHHLVGVTNLQRRLSQLLCGRTEIRLFCLTGIGGIGKTALADALAREVIAGGCFADLAWISARQRQFSPWEGVQETDHPALTVEELVISLDRQLGGIASPPRPLAETLSALKARLASAPHLIILDNLETVKDYQELLPVLRELRQFAWILLTSRVSLHEQPDIHITNLNELNSADAAALLHDEAFRRGLDDLAEAPAETMARIYSIAGGNPLALKLIVGQVQVRSLSTVLDDLMEAQGQRVEALYEFIYHRAWDLLAEQARHVLLAMPLVAAPGTTLTHLAGVTGLARDELDDALDLLIRLSLVHVGGSLNERRYYIHRLTETFLHKQVTKWV